MRLPCRSGGLTLHGNLPESFSKGSVPEMNMKQMRCLFLVLALGSGWCAQRSQAQTIAQRISFSIICQYVTNTYNTNAEGTGYENQTITTVLINTPNLVRAIAVDLFWTNNVTTWTTNWEFWSQATINFEQTLSDGHQGIFLRYGKVQTNIDRFFTNTSSFNGFSNMFSQCVPTVFGGTNYTVSGTNPSTLPLNGGHDYLVNSGQISNNYAASDNLAYLAFSSTNTSFTLFGYSQGSLTNVGHDSAGQLVKVPQGPIYGAGTFSLNLTTNFLRFDDGFLLYYDLAHGVVTTRTATNTVPATNFVGLAHGSVNLGQPYNVDVEGP
jgi:hypothetical protein